MYLNCACRLHVTNTNVATVASRLARSVACDLTKTSTAGSTGTAVSTRLVGEGLNPEKINIKAFLVSFCSARYQE